MASYPQENLCVVLIGARNPLNIGAAARAMSNFGFTDLRVVAPYEAAFREARSAVGALDLLRNAREFPTLSEAIAGCTLVVGTTAGVRRRLNHTLAPLQEGAPRMREHLTARRAALLFGPEKRGMSNQDFNYCHWLMRIPTVGSAPSSNPPLANLTNPSMNLGQAVAVCLYELIRDEAQPVEPSAPILADAAQLERMTQALFRALKASAYVKAGSDESSLEKMRRMVWRMTLNPEDAETWTGMLDKMEWPKR